MNTVILIGYLGCDAKSPTTRNNSTLTVLSLATNRVWKDRETGERQSQMTGTAACLSGRRRPTLPRSPRPLTSKSLVKFRLANMSPKTVQKSPSSKSAFGASRI